MTAPKKKPGKRAPGRPQGPEKAHLSVYVSPETATRVRVARALFNRPVSAIIEDALNAHLKELGVPRVKLAHPKKSTNIRNTS